MTLRTRLLLTFIALGAVPLMVVGWVTSQRNLQAVEDLVARETRLVAERVSEEIGGRYDILQGELLFLAENLETLRLFGESPLPSFASAVGGPGAFLSREWESLAGRYQWAQFENLDGQPVFSLPAGEDSLPGFSDSGGFVLSENISSADGGRVLGRVSAAILPAVVLPGNLSERGFGESGFVALIDTEARRVLYHPQGSSLSGLLSQILPATGEKVGPNQRVDRGLEYSLGDEAWIGTLAPVRRTSWAVLSSSPLEGFSRPFQTAARANLLLVFTITLLTAAAFLFSTLRTTRSLVDLTAAAKQVAGGNLRPDLPPGGRDEVGTLSGTFRGMLGRIRSMIRQVEENRQMAAVGEFSAQIAHELRNPLTAIRMSLQGLHRKLSGSEHARPLEIALQETDRLDRVASGVLSLGRRTRGQATEISVVDLVKGAAKAMASELHERGVDIALRDESGEVQIQVDEEALRGALINLIRNSMEAMPEGGEIEISVEADENGLVNIHIIDEGSGIQPDLSERIFDPFVTTKDRGNGFGLPLALRAVEENSGRLLVLNSPEFKGAHFVLEIPTTGGNPMDDPGADS